MEDIMNGLEIMLSLFGLLVAVLVLVYLLKTPRTPFWKKQGYITIEIKRGCGGPAFESGLTDGENYLWDRRRKDRGLC
jgi:hypothetical protein